MLEKEIEKAVCKYAAEKHGAYVRKFTSPSHCSVPDRLLLFPNGVVLFIEFKAPGKQPTGAQVREFERIRAVGQKVIVVDDIEFGKIFVDAFAAA
jgi:hypothetical protein